MAVEPRYIADSSALNRLSKSPVKAKLGPLIRDGLVATCAAIDLEQLYSSHNPDEYEKDRATRSAVFCYIETEEADWQQALHVQRELARKSQLRGVGIPDLIVAAVAERNDLVILHYDADYDRISEVTGQPVEWVVPRGSID
ncbi:PIN domain nuclease [Nonomuraea endophytica]|uniref:PIN domain nuclease n=1 Tax=Nonomuraea endophytica TaxID=714136 RepID=UPI0037CC44CB